MHRRPMLLAVLALILVGCGEDGRDAPVPDPPVATASPRDFPAVTSGDTVAELTADLPEGPILTPAVSLLEKGRNRVGFALFDAARTQLSGAQVALYVAKPDGTAVRGPYVARSESLEVSSAFVSRTSEDDPDSAKSVYVADVPFKRSGKVTVTAVARLDGHLMRSEPEAMTVGAKGATPPGVGERAIVIDTETVASAGGDVERIDTRVPPAPELHRENFRDVLGRKPVVLVFATPLLCQSRVCGPVVDVALQVKARVGDDVAFIHQEVFKDNRVERGVRPQLGAWRLVTEPWTFVIDRKGIVRARFEGALSAAELERAVAEVAR
ncbi:MAG: hypothetical protein JWO90_106 [Solirubrobacterales bacterium]|jgi:hypothetical protein|nr:hypothetical protein [Solirubrobacterales bacterium]